MKCLRFACDFVGDRVGLRKGSFVCAFVGERVVGALLTLMPLLRLLLLPLLLLHLLLRLRKLLQLLQLRRLLLLLLLLPRVGRIVGVYVGEFVGLDWSRAAGREVSSMVNAVTRSHSQSANPKGSEASSRSSHPYGKLQTFLRTRVPQPGRSQRFACHRCSESQ